MSLDEFFGTLTKKDGTTVKASEALAGKDYLICVWSASWCGPCLQVSPMISAFHDKHSASKKFETILISRDRDTKGFKSYFDHVSYNYAVAPGPVSDSLSKKFKIQGIPSIFVFDVNNNMQVITSEGRMHIMKDSNATNFPWKPRSMWEVLGDVAARNGNKAFVDKDNNSMSFAELKSKKGVGLYFSASWCPPCKGFTPKLADWYNSKHQKEDIEIIFVSSDRDEKSYKEYLSHMPWKGLAFNEKKAKEELDAIFKVEGIPTLVFIDGEGNTLTTDGRSKVISSPDNFPWPPSPVDPLDDASEYLNDETVAILFTEYCTDNNNLEKCEKAFKQVAQQYFDANSKKPSTKMRFAIATEGDEIADRVRNFLGKSHMSDKNGPDSLRVTVLSIPEQSKYSFRKGATGVFTADELKTFIDAVVAGSVDTEPLKA